MQCMGASSSLQRKHNVEEEGGVSVYSCARIRAGLLLCIAPVNVTVISCGGVLEQEPDADEYYLHSEEGSWGKNGQENVVPPELEGHMAPGPHHWQDVSLVAS